MERDTPKLVIIGDKDNYPIQVKCGNCENPLTYITKDYAKKKYFCISCQANYCPNCGQKLSWDNVEEFINESTY